MIENPKVLIRAEMRPDGYEYSVMLLVSVDDNMIIFYLGDQLSKQIGGFYKYQGRE